MNQLYYGDNLDVLRRYIRDESVDLCYIDPPFNSKRNYNQIYNNIGKEDKAQAQAFVDTWTWDTVAEHGLDEILTNYHGRFTRQTIALVDGLLKVIGKGALLAYLISMTLRIVEIHRALKSTGSFYLHCDPSASHYLKIILDGVFCSQGGDFKNEIVWSRSQAKGNAFSRFATNHDVILSYAKSTRWVWNQQYTPHHDSYIESAYRHIESETGRRYRLDNLANPNKNRPNLTYEFLGVTRVWRWTRERMQEAYEKGLVVQTNPGTVPAYKRYLDEQEGNPVGDVWNDISTLQSNNKETLGYPTQKPEALLDRIIRASSNEGDVVLDAYCGCGTTVAAATRLKRQWLGIDITYQSISLILKRLEDTYGKPVLNRVKVNGVPKDFEAAVALAHQKDDRTRKEFEKWAVLTFSENRAIINEKKGGDGGIDGTAFVLDGQMNGQQEMKPIIFSVKSNETLTPAVVRELYGTVEREKAAMGYLLTLNSMDNLVRESKKYGFYTNELFGSTYPKIEVISVRDILKGERIRIPLNQKIDVIKSAKEAGSTNQLGLFS